LRSLSKIVVPKAEYDKLTPPQKAAVDKMDPSQFPTSATRIRRCGRRTLLGLQLSPCTEQQADRV